MPNADEVEYVHGRRARAKRTDMDPPEGDDESIAALVAEERAMEERLRAAQVPPLAAAERTSGRGRARRTEMIKSV